MPDTFVKIATVTVGSGGAATMAFSSIPSTYTDLCIKMSSRADADTVSSLISFILTLALEQHRLLPTVKSISADAVEENNGTTAFAGLSAALWSNTAAITSITLTPQTGSYVQYSTATLYGISKS